MKLVYKDKQCNLNLNPISAKYFRKDELQFRAMGKVFEHFYHPGAVAYDIGANCGTVSAILAMIGFEVHAIEPSHRNCICLENLDKQYPIHIHRVAFDEREWACTCKFPDCNSDPIEQTIQFKVFGQYQKEASIPDPDVIKIDIEGAETVVLNTMTDLLKTARPVWYIEWHNQAKQKNLKPIGFKTPQEGGFDLMSLKTKYDYQLLDNKLQDTVVKDGRCHYFAIPKEKMCCLDKKKTITIL